MLAVAEGKPDVVVLDIERPGTNSFEIARAVRKIQSRCTVMFIGGPVDDRIIQAALDTGAMAYLTMQESPCAVAAAIREAANGRAVFSGRVRERLGVNCEDASSSKSRRNLLTPRELEIVRYISQGLSNKEIAIRAKIKPKTVEAHCAHIRHKLNVRGRIGVVRFAFREGMAAI